MFAKGMLVAHRLEFVRELSIAPRQIRKRFVCIRGPRLASNILID